ncbi:MAG: FxLYD domain-containing protein [Candidatus Poribacteria bacterium]|nr:FxLYD domain-containing protein [Candidatus Poribacteria bacterium]
MNHYLGILTAIAFTLILITGITGCTRDDETSTPNPIAAGASDEESAVQLALTDTYDNVRNGAHLIMSYDAATNSFTGTVKNTTGAILPEVRVEIHLFNNRASVAELGPTPSRDLAPGEEIPIELMAIGSPFDTWTAHPEVGPSSGGGSEGTEASGEHGQGGAHN